MAALDSRAHASTFDMKEVERDLRKGWSEWRGLVKRQMPLSRQVLTELLDGRVAWTPRKDEGRYDFAGRVTFDGLPSGTVVTQGVVAVRGIEPRFDG